MKRLRQQTGSNLVEFALVLPLLLILVFGIADFSLALYDKAIITNASREGARAGMVFRHPARVPVDEIIAVVENYCSDYLVTFGTTTTPDVSVDIGTDSGDTVTVTVAFTYEFAALMKLMPGPDTVTFTAVTVMRME